MKRGRKTDISTEEIRRELISHKYDILQNNTLIKSSNILWKNLIEKYKWNITPKALWTRLHKYSPNFDNFFESVSKHDHITHLLSEEDNYTSEDQFSNSDDSDLNEANNTVNIYSIFVSAEMWNEIQRNDGIKNKLKPGVWTDTFSEIIYKTHSINCAWSYKTHEVTTSESSEYFLVFSAICTDKKCNTKMKGEVLRHKNYLDPSIYGLTIILHLKVNYKVPHKKRRLGGERRKKVSSYLLETNTTSSKYRKDQAKILCKNLFDPESKLLPRLETIRKAKSEQYGKNRFDSDELISLNIMQNCNPWQQIIHSLGFQPFFVHYWSPEQLRVYNSYVKKDMAPKICIYATGNVNKSQTTNQYIQLYIYLHHSNKTSQ